MQRQTQQRDVQRLLQRWTMELAAHLVGECLMTRRQAMRQAWLVRRLMESLGRGEVTFRFRERDGSLRQARGTLRRGVSEAFDSYRYKTCNGREPSADLFVYWDLDKDAFRTFKPESVMDIGEKIED